MLTELYYIIWSGRSPLQNNVKNQFIWWNYSNFFRIFSSFLGFFRVFLDFFGYFWVFWVFLVFFGFLKFYTILSFFNQDSLLFTSKNNFYTPWRVCGGLGAQPPVGLGGEATRHMTISPLINDNNVNNKNDFLYSKYTMVCPLHYIPW